MAALRTRTHNGHPALRLDLVNLRLSLRIGQCAKPSDLLIDLLSQLRVFGFARILIGASDDEQAQEGQWHSQGHGGHCSADEVSAMGLSAAPEGVRTGNVAGVILHGSRAIRFEELAIDFEEAEFLGKIPMGRAADAREIANVIAFLPRMRGRT